MGAGARGGSGSADTERRVFCGGTNHPIPSMYVALLVCTQKRLNVASSLSFCPDAKFWALFFERSQNTLIGFGRIICVLLSPYTVQNTYELRFSTVRCCFCYVIYPASFSPGAPSVSLFQHIFDLIWTWGGLCHRRDRFLFFCF